MSGSGHNAEHCFYSLGSLSPSFSPVILSLPFLLTRPPLYPFLALSFPLHLSLPLLSLVPVFLCPPSPSPSIFLSQRNLLDMTWHCVISDNGAHAFEDYFLSRFCPQTIHNTGFLLSKVAIKPDAYAGPETREETSTEGVQSRITCKPINTVLKHH